VKEPQPVNKHDLLDHLPPVWPDDALRHGIAIQNARTARCIVALDDDPTGTQTVHDIWVLTRWEVKDLKRALVDGEPALYVLTNSRSMPLEQAKSINREVATNLVEAADAIGRPLTVVSRSDSTLRGHFPGEVEALEKALVKLQGERFDGLCLLPFFPEGGRFTVNNVHWVQEDDLLIPAAQTPYARDSVFGYSNSSLPEWVEEKTQGKIRADEVITISLERLRLQGPSFVYQQLIQVRNGKVIIVNAADYRDLEVFVVGLLEAVAKGRRFLFRSAASFVKVAAGLQDKPLLTTQELIVGSKSTGGLIVFGSYVPKSTAQLHALCEMEGTKALELPVGEILSDERREETIQQTARHANKALSSGQDVVIYTSRKLITVGNKAENLAIGKTVSTSLMEVVKRIESEPRYVIGKGGITSSDLATTGLKARAARVLGQVLPGVPVWRLGPDSRWPGLAYVVFPGNVGDRYSVAHAAKVPRG
jgi:uncharacterized protein YgbK (DUF1537 family)